MKYGFSALTTGAEHVLDERRDVCTAFFTSAKMVVQGGMPLPVTILDISAEGIGIALLEAVSEERSCVISLCIQIGSQPRRIVVWGTLVHCTPTATGFRAGVKYRDFDSMSKACLVELSNMH